MGFDLETWKANLTAQLKDWRLRMKQVGAKSIYAFVSAATLWPVAEALRLAGEEAAKSGNWASVMALGGVLSSVGGNLVANRIQNWKDEADAARQIDAGVAADSSLRAELDVILEKLDVLAQAQQVLPEADRQWFVETLRAELAQQGNLERFESQLTGSGAAAQGLGSTAAGKHGIVSQGQQQGVINTGKVQGDIVNVVNNRFSGQANHDSDAALTVYQRVLMTGYRYLPLRGLDVGISDATRSQESPELAHVYVNLNVISQGSNNEEMTRSRVERGTLQSGYPLKIGALKAVTMHRRIVLLGDPGAGKSTFLSHLALCLAGHNVEPQGKWFDRLSGWPFEERGIVPVLIILRDLARWLPEGSVKPEPHLLWDFIVSRLKAQNLGFVVGPLHEQLNRGRALLLLDGFDEVPTPRQRTMVRDLLTQCAIRYESCRMIMTCRRLSYQDPAWQLNGFPAFELAPFDDAQVEQFIDAWYEELIGFSIIQSSEGLRLAETLRKALYQPDLRRMASNPLLLTVMALVHTHKGRLPDTRAQLYEEAVEILLWQWEQHKVEGDVPRLRQLLAQAGRAEVDLRRVIGEVAFEVQRQGGTADEEAVAGIGELRLQKALAFLHPEQNREWAHQVIEAIKFRAGLLVERSPEVYTFPHRTFQEYLAGAYLTTRPQFAQEASRLVTEGAFWREVILLAVGRLVHVHGDPERPLLLVAELCPAQPMNNESAWRQACLAGDVLAEVGLNRVRDSALGRELGERVRQRLVELLRACHLSPVERAVAGNTLARLGDPRFRADAWYLPDEPLLGFIDIPAGSFLMGSDRRWDPQARDEEMPQHEVYLPQYFIGRYPVTVAQFQAFASECDYITLSEVNQQGSNNQPVVNLTWYEAMEYCRWLTQRFREWPSTPEPLATLLEREGWIITLPSEAEWEKAARGPGERIYPWGSKPSQNLANYDATDINSTSAVGCFPEGASPFGVEDLGGNVWEWTRSLWGKEFKRTDYKYPYESNDGRENLEADGRIRRILRGGAFDFLYWNMRCAYRRWNIPKDSARDLGFRVVLRSPL